MLKTQELQINIGPQHPSTHGVFRLIVTVDGETIVDLKPVFGYLHRNHEQLGEVSTYIQSMPFTRVANAALIPFTMSPTSALAEAGKYFSA